MIRKLTIEDYGEIYQLWQSTPGVGISDSDSRENIQVFLKRNPNLSFVFESDQKIVGTILSGHDGRRGFIYHLAVDKDFRNHKIGFKLVEKCLWELKSVNILKCHLFVYDNNEIGKEFWNKLYWTKRDDILIFSKQI